MPVHPAIVEAMGYLASGLVVASLAMTSVRRLRVLSLLGSATYAVYGTLISAWPVVAANGVIVLLNVWNLRREFSRPRDLAAPPIEPDAPLLDVR